MIGPAGFSSGKGGNCCAVRVPALELNTLAIIYMHYNTARIGPQGTNEMMA